MLRLEATTHTEFDLDIRIVATDNREQVVENADYSAWPYNCPTATPSCLASCTECYYSCYADSTTNCIA